MMKYLVKMSKELSFSSVVFNDNALKVDFSTRLCAKDDCSGGAISRYDGTIYSVDKEEGFHFPVCDFSIHRGKYHIMCSHEQHDSELLSTYRSRVNSKYCDSKLCDTDILIITVNSVSANGTFWKDIASMFRSIDRVLDGQGLLNSDQFYIIVDTTTNVPLLKSFFNDCNFN